MSASVHLMGGDLGRITTTAERDICGHICLHLRNNARCDSATATLSEREAWAVVDSLTAVLPARSSKTEVRT